MRGWGDLPEEVKIHEVGPRDGLQAEDEFVPTEKKVGIIDALSRTGVASVQVTSVVHPKAVPQLADAERVMAEIERRPGVGYTVLVPNLRGAERAVPLRADAWELMLSVTDSHSRSNANRSTGEALAGMEPVVELAREIGVEVAGGMATALGCPFEGRVPFGRVLYVAEAYRAMGVRRLSVADTVGVADPRLVYETLSGLKERLPDVEFGLHLHNTRGMALANVLAALRGGVTSFDSSVGGLGGCPFAPGATGNVSTEDLVHMLGLIGVRSGVDLDAVLAVSRGVRETVGHPLESAVLRAGKAGDLHEPPGCQVLRG
jgi:hydroxymethylglutaryl-CoA lyase